MSLQGGLAVTETTSFKGKIHADSISTSGELSVCGSATIRNKATVCGPQGLQLFVIEEHFVMDQSGSADFFAIRAFGRVNSAGNKLGWLKTSIEANLW